MCSTDEYQQQQYWKESWIDKQHRKLISKISKQNEEMFCKTHEILMAKFKQFKKLDK